MAKIFIGIPTVRTYKPFWESLENFLIEANKEHTVEVYTVANKPLAEARNTIVSRFLNSDYEYLLFLDDDHTGHSMEMLNSLFDPLINNDQYICAIKCYTKEFPYFSNLLEYSGVDPVQVGLPPERVKYRSIEDTNGYIHCDLVGFGMTLMKSQIFNKIDEPYFYAQNNGREDNYFCDKLVQSGIRPVGCFDHVLEHAGIGKHNALELRKKGIEKLRAELMKDNPNLQDIVLVS